jgi:hypothetical protein
MSCQKILTNESSSGIQSVKRIPPRTDLVLTFSHTDCMLRPFPYRDSAYASADDPVASSAVKSRGECFSSLLLIMEIHLVTSDSIASKSLTRRHFFPCHCRASKDECLGILSPTLISSMLYIAGAVVKRGKGEAEISNSEVQ